MGGFFDSLFGGGGSSSGGGSIWPAAILASTQLISSIFGGDSSGDTDYKYAALAQEKELANAQLAQQLEIAKMNAATAGAGSGAYGQAAGIAAAASRYATKQRAIADLGAITQEAIKNQKPELLAQAWQLASQLKQKGGEDAAAMFDNLAARVQAPLLRKSY